MKFLSETTFGVYVFHAPVLIGITVFAKGITINVIPKFFITGALAISGALVVSWIIHQIPSIGKIFN